MEKRCQWCPPHQRKYRQTRKILIGSQEVHLCWEHEMEHVENEKRREQDVESE